MRASKRFLSVLVVAAMLISCMGLTGCHGSKGMAKFEVPDEFDTSKPISITFWAKNDTNSTQVNIYKKAISDFESYYPNIDVTLKLYTDYSRIYHDVITNIQTNTTPNVCITYPDHIATYMTGVNTVVKLDDLFDHEKYGLGGSEVRFDSVKKEEIVPKFLQECIVGDGYYALPYVRSTEALYINRTYVERLGYVIPDQITWEWIFEVSKAATEKNDDGTYKLNGQNVMIPFIYKSTDNMMIQMLEQLEAGYSTSEGDILIFNDDTRHVLDMVADAVECGSFSTFKISSYPGNFFNAGQCIFAIDSTAGATWIGADAPLSDIAQESIVDFETEVRVIPQFDYENPKMISQGPSMCIFNKADKMEVLASWLFMQFLLTDDVQIDYSSTEGYVPVTLKAQGSDKYQDYLAREGEDNQYYYEVKIKAAKLLIDNVEDTFVTPVFNGSASLRSAAGQMIENVAKSIRRNETIDEAYFEKLYSDVTSLYHLDQLDTTGNSAKPDMDLGPLPTEAVVFLCLLGVAWVGIATYFVADKIKTKKRQISSK
ncbi:MAG: extracellular solute-binding protein [Clostridia bacterium]|nr:extracellular solute-binding protein [Clostridia bacterium]